MNILDGKRFFIYGDGASGRAARRAVKKLGGRAAIYSDEGGRFSEPPAAKYDGGIISPGIKPSHPVYGYCASHGIRALGEAELGLKIAAARCIATAGITGTNGKTTVTRLVADITGGTACGNIGYPVTAALFGGASPLVVELSSFQLYNAKIAPDVAVITNTSPDHVDWHGSKEEYYAAKCNIANGMRGGFLVLGPDVTVDALKTLSTDAQILYCSVTGACDGAYVENGRFMFLGESVCSVDYLRLRGEHNIKNALCAIAAAKCLGASNGEITDGLSRSAPAPHRIEPAGEACGKKWIDDSKGTNVSATLAAVDETEGTVCLILGGRSKATDFGALFASLCDRVTEIVAMGESAQAVRDSAKAASPSRKITVVDGLMDAVAAAAVSGADTVLLSPACASFDEFSSYSERGDAFKAEVARLGGGGSGREKGGRFSGKARR